MEYGAYQAYIRVLSKIIFYLLQDGCKHLLSSMSLQAGARSEELQYQIKTANEDIDELSARISKAQGKSEALASTPPAWKISGLSFKAHS